MGDVALAVWAAIKRDTTPRDHASVDEKGQGPGAVAVGMATKIAKVAKVAKAARGRHQAIFVQPSCRSDCGSIKIQRPLVVLPRGRAWPISEDLAMADGYERAYEALLTPAPIGVRAIEMPETPSNP